MGAEQAAVGGADWLALCRAQRFDPAEVRLVISRYEAYQRYYSAGGRGEPLALAAWFNWYRMETASEVEQNAPSPSGCSVDPNAEYRGAIRRPQEFLVVLLAMAAAGGIR